MQDAIAPETVSAWDSVLSPPQGPTRQYGSWDEALDLIRPATFGSELAKPFTSLAEFGKKLPVAGGAVEGAELWSLIRSAEAVRGGTATQEDEDRLFYYTLEQARGREPGALFASILTDLPGYMGEFAMSGGAFTAGRRVGRKALAEIVESQVEKGLARTAAATARRLAGIGAGAVRQSVSLPMQPRLWASILRTQLDDQGIAIGEDEAGAMALQIAETAPGFVESIPEGYARHFSELFGEHTGSELSRIPGVAYVNGLLGQVAGRIAKATGKSAPEVINVMRRSALPWDGMVAEFGEEIVTNAMNAAITDDEWTKVLPTGGEAVEMLAAFAVPGAAAAGLQATVGGKQDLRMPEGAAEQPVEPVEADSKQGDVPRGKEEPIDRPTVPVDAEQIPGWQDFTGGAAARVVAPTTAEDKYAEEMVGRRGAQLALVEFPEGNPTGNTAAYAKGFVLLDANSTERERQIGVLSHELAHHLKATDAETFESLASFLRGEDPRGVATARAFREKLGEQGGVLEEEAIATYVQALPNFLKAAKENPEALRQLIAREDSRTLVQRLLDGLRAVAAKLGLPVDSPALARLKEAEAALGALTGAEAAQSPAKTAKIAQQITDALDTLTTADWPKRAPLEEQFPAKPDADRMKPDSALETESAAAKTPEAAPETQGIPAAKRRSAVGGPPAGLGGPAVAEAETESAAAEPETPKKPRKLQPGELRIKRRKGLIEKQRAAKNFDLVSWIRSIGGIKGDDAMAGEIRALFGGLQHQSRQRVSDFKVGWENFLGPLLRAPGKGGNTLDYIRESAAQSGWLSPAEIEEGSLSDFVELIKDTWTGSNRRLEEDYESERLEDEYQAEVERDRDTEEFYAEQRKEEGERTGQPYLDIEGRLVDPATGRVLFARSLPAARLYDEGEEDATKFAKPTKDFPEDLRDAANLLTEDRRWQRAVTTKGARVVVDDEGVEGVVVEPARDPVDGQGRSGMALVRYPYRERSSQGTPFGEPVESERWVSALRLSAVPTPFDTKLAKAPPTDSEAFKAWFGLNSTSIPESRVNSLRRDAILLANLAVSPSFRAQGLSGLERPGQLLSAVRRVSKDAQVADAVVELIPVDVVNILSSRQFSAQDLLNDPSVLKYLLSGNGDGSVSTAVDIADALAVAVAQVSAKLSGAALELPRGTGQFFAAPRTGAGDLISSGHSLIVLPNGATVKSTGNRGTYDPSNPDIRFAKPTQGELFDSYGSPTLSQMDRARRRLQDLFLPIKRTQEHLKKLGRTISEPEDVYEAETVWAGRVNTRAERMERKWAKPMVQAMAAGKIELEDAGLYLYARHAPTANKVAAERNPQAFGSEESPGSGMRTSVANKIVADAESGPAAEHYKKIAELFDAMNAERLQYQVDTGLISEEKRDAWIETFGTSWAPLRSNKKGGRSLSIGSGFDIRGPEAKRRGGRKSMAENPLLFALEDYERAIVRGEKNRVDQSLHALVTKNPDPKVWAVRIGPEKGVVEEEQRDALQKPEFEPLAENEVSVKIQGQQYIMSFADPSIPRAMRKMNVEHAGKALQTLSGFMRWLSAVNTSFDPGFVVSNFLRDLQTAGLNLSADGKKEMVAEVVRRTPKAINGIRKVLRSGDTKGEWAPWYQEFQEEGGSPGWFHLENIEKRAASLSTLLANAKGERKVQRALRSLADFVADYNSAVELGVRLSSYRSLRERGVSKQKAAAYAKELTVNFNRKGELGTWLNSFYLFYNAGMQGSARMVRAITSPTGRKIALGIAGLGLTMDMLARAMADDDEETGENQYDQIPEYVKARNIVIMLPGGKHLTIPMPYGYSFFHSLGRAIGEVAPREIGGGGKGVTEVAPALAEAAWDSFVPIGGEKSLLQRISPTVLDPLVQVAENKDWTGSPLKPFDFPGDMRPESQRYFSSVSPAAREVSAFLNRMSGGDKADPGAIDVSPEVLEHWYEFIAGGLGRQANRFVTLFEQGEATPLAKVPILRRVLSETPEWYVGGRYRELADEVRRAEHAVKVAREDKDTETARRKQQEYRDLLSLSGFLKATERRLKKLREREDKEAMQKLQARFIRRFHEVTTP